MNYNSEALGHACHAAPFHWQGDSNTKTAHTSMQLKHMAVANCQSATYQCLRRLGCWYGSGAKPAGLQQQQQQQQLQ
jgi:hypothetical protein